MGRHTTSFLSAEATQFCRRSKSTRVSLGHLGHSLLPPPEEPWVGPGPLIFKLPRLYGRRGRSTDTVLRAVEGNPACGLLDVFAFWSHYQCRRVPLNRSPRSWMSRPPSPLGVSIPAPPQIHTPQDPFLPTIHRRKQCAAIALSPDKCQGHGMASFPGSPRHSLLHSKDWSHENDMQAEM